MSPPAIASAIRLVAFGRNWNLDARNAGLRIDHILLSSSIADRLVAAGVDRHARGWEKTSDHAPTWIIIADEPSKNGKAAKTASSRAPAKKKGRARTR